MAQKTDESIITFGKFKGEKFANIPAWYWLWMEKQPWFNNKDIQAYIDDNREVFDLEQKRDSDE